MSRHCSEILHHNYTKPLWLEEEMKRCNRDTHLHLYHPWWTRCRACEGMKTQQTPPSPRRKTKTDRNRELIRTTTKSTTSQLTEFNNQLIKCFRLVLLDVYFWSWFTGLDIYSTVHTQYKFLTSRETFHVFSNLRHGQLPSEVKVCQHCWEFRSDVRHTPYA